MTEETRLAAIDESLLAACEHWTRAAERERATAINLTSSHERRANCGALFAETDAGDKLRARIREAEKSAQVAEDHAVKLRRELLGVGPRTRGVGKKEPLKPEAPTRDAATSALIERANAKRAAKDALAESRKACREAAIECDHDPACAWTGRVEDDEP